MLENDSLAIKISRVICIFFVSYVHVNPSMDKWVDEVPAQLSIFGTIGTILLDVLGRASVPALSVLGGYLAVSAYSRRSNWWVYAKERWQTLIVPMITWNLVIIALSSIILAVTGVQTKVIQDIQPFEQLTPLLILDRLTGYNYGSAAVALDFLRDIFVCSLLLPLMFQLNKRLGAVGVGIIWLTGLTVSFAPIVMKPSIMMFFTIGVYLALQSDQLIPSRETVIKLITVLFLALVLVYFTPVLSANYAKNVPNIVFRLVITSCLLITAIALSRINAGRLIARLEPVAYLMFLSHTTIMLILWGIWQKPFGNGLAWPYPIFFIAAPFITMIAVLGLHKVLKRMPAIVQKIVIGKNISRQHSSD
jgi:succinoglycan biosynthesis protein ExoH